MAPLQSVAARFARKVFQLVAGRPVTDLVSVGRSLVNDPAWAQRVRDGEPLLPFDPASLRVLT